MAAVMLLLVAAVQNRITGVLMHGRIMFPSISVSGQCNRHEMMTIKSLKLGQIGLQEADIISIVASITKYAVTIMEPDDAVYCIERALYEERTGIQGLYGWTSLWMSRKRNKSSSTPTFYTR